MSVHLFHQKRHRFYKQTVQLSNRYCNGGRFLINENTKTQNEAQFLVSKGYTVTKRRVFFRFLRDLFQLKQTHFLSVVRF